MPTRPAPTVHLIAGARPNFMKIAPIIRALREDGQLRWRLIHTGQHYDRNMSEVFFEELGIPTPDVHFNCGGGTHAAQTARIMEAFESHCAAEHPDAVVVVGDVNSTMACAIVAKKASIPVAHVEAGLRSGDMAMPEEINRIVTDSISDWFYVTEPSGIEHLTREGHRAEDIEYVGHVMVDNLLFQLEQLKAVSPPAIETHVIKERLGRYGVVTLHRPSNVDDSLVLSRIVGALRLISTDLPLVFPVHPRTRAKLEQLPEGLGDRVHLLDPLPYMAFLHLWKDAAVILTDSGGLQEESTAIGVPCVTLRENTERPVTVSVGTNTLAGTDPHAIIAAASRAILVGHQPGRRPELWDGRAAKRIVASLTARLLV